MMYLGIDPGAVSGAWGLINHHSDYVASGTIPHEDGRILAKQFKDDLRQAIGNNDFMVVIEDVHSMPKQGVSSTFKFGRAVGAIQAVTELMNVPWFIINPKSWKKAMGVTSEKETSLIKARELWKTAPLKLKKNHGVAESLLLAEWLRRQG
jgi:Holliday junction resolvasome RuvABC endonuclease subunit